MRHGADGECMQQLVSIIVPAYNAERFIARTLRSALRQTYVTFEMIVIDDGSTDSTGAVARAFAQSDERVRVISVPNGGVAKARNIGISEAAGELVAFLDADDLWHPTKLERQMAALDEMKDAAAVYTLSRDIDVDDRVFGSWQAGRVQRIYLRTPPLCKTDWEWQYVAGSARECIGGGGLRTVVGCAGDWRMRGSRLRIEVGGKISHGRSSSLPRGVSSFSGKHVER